MNSVTIRKATLEDVEGVAQLLYELLNVDDLTEAREAFLREMQKGDKYIIAEKDSKIIGLVSWLMHGRPKHGLAELYHIIISKEVRGLGIGTKLFKELVNDLKSTYAHAGSKIRKLFLLTRATNRHAQQFYKKVGLRYETILKNHFYEGKDEWVMSRFFD